MSERLNAVASGALGLALPTLTWGLDRMGVQIPPLVVKAIVIGSVLLILFSVVCWTHIFLKWLGVAEDKLPLTATWKDGRVQGGPLRAIIAVVVTLLIVGTVVWTTSDLPPPRPGPGATFVANVFDIWASDDEIERFRKEGRTLVRYSPDRLSAIYTTDGEDAIARYRGKWVKISHAFHDVKNNPNDPTTLVVRLGGDAWILMYAIFDLKKYDDRLSQFVAPQRVNAACQIDFTRLASNQITFKGYNCEFEHWDGR